jgi:hypothetical protein
MIGISHSLFNCSPELNFVPSSPGEVQTQVRLWMSEKLDKRQKESVLLYLRHTVLPTRHRTLKY